MKHRKIFLLIFFPLLSYVTMASGSDEFSFDNQLIKEEFSELSALETLIATNGYPGLSELEDNQLLKSGYLSSNLSFPGNGEDPLGIPGFWWGCVLGPIGIIAAYILSDNNKDQARMSLNGCIVATVVQVAVVVVWYFAIMSWNYTL